MRPTLPIAVLALLSSLHTGGAVAAEFFQTRNEGLLSRAVSLPPLVPHTPAEGRINPGLRLEIVSEYVAISQGNEQITLDGEATKLTLSAAGRYSPRSHWALRVPVMYQGGGFMDSIINDWHDFWGLPEGGRDQAPKNQYLYHYERDGEVLLSNTESGARLGDIEVSWHFEATEGLTLSTQLQLPTGDTDRYAGGGTIGGSFWGTYAAESGRWSGFGAAGVSFNGRGDILPGQQRRTTPFGGAGVGFELMPWLRVVGQVYAHTALFKDSELSPLERDSIQLSLGGIFRLGESTRLHLLFQEDLGVNASPDFSIQAALYW
jgi:hypothetical protein